MLFSGDLLFAGSIGRTDLPGGDHDAILRVAGPRRACRCRTSTVVLLRPRHPDHDRPRARDQPVPAAGSGTRLRRPGL